MGPWQLLIVGILIWLSGALFGAGWLSWRSALARPKAYPHDRRVYGGRSLIRGNLIWWVIGGGIVWAIAVAVSELAATDFWSLARVAFWTPP